MSEIELYVHSPMGADPTLVKIEAQALVEGLLKKIQEAGLCDGTSEEIYIFAEDEGEPLAKQHSIEHHGIKHRHHVHCHTCHRVRVLTTYNGVEKGEVFPPSTKVKRVLKWAIDSFDLKGADAENKVLRLIDPPQTELPNDAHIGSFVHRHHCEVKVALVPRIRFQG